MALRLLPRLLDVGLRFVLHILGWLSGMRHLGRLRRIVRVALDRGSAHHLRVDVGRTGHSSAVLLILCRPLYCAGHLVLGDAHTAGLHCKAGGLLSVRAYGWGEAIKHVAKVKRTTQIFCLLALGCGEMWGRMEPRMEKRFPQSSLPTIGFPLRSPAGGCPATNWMSSSAMIVE